jgi:hypothetical protein
MTDHILNLLKIQALDFHETTDVSESQRTELRDSIPQPILAHYDRLAVRGKKGVAPGAKPGLHRMPHAPAHWHYKYIDAEPRRAVV